MKFSEFSKFFAEQNTLNNDDIIAEFRNSSRLSRFKTRELKTIYSAAEQFYFNTRIRIAKFASHFVDLKTTANLPNSWLLKRDQNVGTFIMLVNSIIRSIDDHLLHEVYVIINNRKTTLLRSLAPFATKQVDSNYLKHRELENSKKLGKSKIIRLPPSSLPPVPELMQGDEENFLNNYERFLSNDDLSNDDLVLESLISDDFTRNTTASPLPLASIDQSEFSLDGAQPVQNSDTREINTPSTTVSPLAHSQRSTMIPTTSTEQTTSSAISMQGILPETQSDLPNLAFIPPSFLLDPQNPQNSEQEGSGSTLSSAMNVVLPLTTASPDRIPILNMDFLYSTLAPDLATTEKQFETLEELRHHFRNQAASNMLRSKRSGFWTKVFGIATSDDMVEAYKNEVDVGLREDAVEKGMSEVRLKTNELLKNYKTMAVDLQKVETQERKLFEYVDQIVKAETDSFKKLELLAKSIDRITIMSSEYQNLNLQTILLIHTIEKTHILVQNAMSGIVDVAQFPADLLQLYNPNNMQTSLRSTHVELSLIHI